MKSSQLKAVIKNICQQDKSLWQKGQFNESLFEDKITGLDRSLIGQLSKHKIVRRQFFKRINDEVVVFDKDNFLLFWQENKVFNSYTRFLNKIGLGFKNSNRFVSENDEVVLNFPFKDCVLQGGQTKQESQENEVFYHEVIARDEIDRLFEQKALDNFWQIDKNGQHQLSGLSVPPPLSD